MSTNRKNTNVWGIPSMETYLTRFDQGKKDISKKGLFYLHGIYSIQTSVLIPFKTILSQHLIPPCHNI
jgi:hypothetical protein